MSIKVCKGVYALLRVSVMVSDIAMVVSITVSNLALAMSVTVRARQVHLFWTRDPDPDPVY
jgi:hypothetical protein